MCWLSIEHYLLGGVYLYFGQVFFLYFPLFNRAYRVWLDGGLG